MRLAFLCGVRTRIQNYLAKSSILTHLRGLAFGDRPSPLRCVSLLVIILI